MVAWMVAWTVRHDRPLGCWFFPYAAVVRRCCGHTLLAPVHVIQIGTIRDMPEETRFINKPRFCCVTCSAVIVSAVPMSLGGVGYNSRNTGVARRAGQQVVQWKGRQRFVGSSLYTLLILHACLISSLLHSAVNVRIGTREDRQLLTGTHTVRPPPIQPHVRTAFGFQVADVYCISCSARLGWTYLKVSLPFLQHIAPP
jgi:hypothetical protein